MTGLYEKVVERSREIRTDGYSMSIGEVLALYRDGDLEIHPEFQRVFRWTPQQQSRLIESILLGIPVPPIFVAQRDDGVWDVIDGVQRLSTILRFAGLYRDDKGELQSGSVLGSGEYLDELAGAVWDLEVVEQDELEASDVEPIVLDERLKRDFKRAKLDFSIVKRESDPNAKYDLFQRLNAGSVLSLQEARNCLLIMINAAAFDQLDGRVNSESFRRSITISEDKENSAYWWELALRFFAQVNYTGSRSQLPQEFGDYLTDWMRTSIDDGSLPFASDLFETTFSLISSAAGADAFRRFDGERHLGGFSIASFEFVTSGVAGNLAVWAGASEDALRDRIREIWSADEFRDKSGSGISSRKRFPHMVLNGRDFFSQP